MTRRRFAQPDIDRFADATGDRNPLHVDPLAARRLLFGSTVAHGVSLVFWALETAAATHDVSAVRRLKATFHAPVRAGTDAELDIEDAPLGLALTVRANGTDALSLRVEAGDGETAAAAPDGPAAFEAAVADPGLGDLGSLSGAVPVASDPALLGDLFPRVVEGLGPWRSAVLASMTRLVGMTCPGRRSLFVGFDIRFDAETRNDRLAYRALSWMPSYGLFEMAVETCGAAGTITSMIRPAPAAVAEAADVARAVPAGAFSGRVALVVGASRGLGAAFASVLALGGASVVLTWRVGEADAQALARRLAGVGGDVATARFDTDSDRAADAVVAALAGRALTDVVYAASPPIQARRPDGFDQSTFERFRAVYVDGALAVVRDLIEADPDGPPVTFHVLSTVYVDDPDPRFREYAAAKADAEAALDAAARGHPRLRIACYRLPPSRTDQTQAVVARDDLADPVEVARACLIDGGFRTGNR